MVDRVDREVHVEVRPAKVAGPRALDTGELRNRGLAKPRESVEREELLALVHEQPHAVGRHVGQFNCRSGAAAHTGSTVVRAAPRREEEAATRISTSRPSAFRKRSSRSNEKPLSRPRLRFDTIGCVAPRTRAASAWVRPRDSMIEAIRLASRAFARSSPDSGVAAAFRDSRHYPFRHSRLDS